MRRTQLVFTLLTLCTAALSLTSLSATESFREERDRHGLTVRFLAPDSLRHVYLIFTADSLFEGADFALDVMKDRNVGASFFLTGNYLRDSLRNGRLIRRIVDEGHYVGPHSDRHLLLADWDAQRTTLISPDSAVADMEANCRLLRNFVGHDAEFRFIVPPYEWCNLSHSEAYRNASYIPVTPFPGILTYRDYTTPDMPDYYSSDTLRSNFLYHLANTNLDGGFVILHLGTQNSRTDKFYHHLPEMLDSLRSRGYSLTPLDF